MATHFAVKPENVGPIVESRQYRTGQFAFGEAIELASVNIMQVRNWIWHGGIYFDGNQRSSKRKHRRFSAMDIFRMAMISKMTQYGFSHQRASVIIEDFIKTNHGIRPLVLCESPHTKLEIDTLQIIKDIDSRAGLRGCAIILFFGWMKRSDIKDICTQ